MSLNLLAILGGITGISGVTAAPITSVTSSAETHHLNLFPLSYTQTLTPGTTSKIPLGLVWSQALDLKNQAESNDWREWGYSEASFLATGLSENGKPVVEFDIGMAQPLLASFIWDLDVIAHDTSAIHSTGFGVFETKVVSTEDAFLAVQLYYVNLLGEETLLMESDSIAPVSLGTVLSFSGNITTTDFHS